MSKPQCKRCGRCCREAHGSLNATPEDITRWRNQHREDILSHAYVFSTGDADLWFDPISGEELGQCPFLKKVGQKKYECTIWQTRPEQCRDWWCILCYESRPFKEGERVPIGARYYIVSTLESCPECQKVGICRMHSFVSTKWLQKYVKKA
jgi:Fe-S-cluster containining protein